MRPWDNLVESMCVRPGERGSDIQRGPRDLTQRMGCGESSDRVALHQFRTHAGRNELVNRSQTSEKFAGQLLDKRLDHGLCCIHIVCNLLDLGIFYICQPALVPRTKVLNAIVDERAQSLILAGVDLLEQANHGHGLGRGIFRVAVLWALQ